MTVIEGFVGKSRIKPEEREALLNNIPQSGFFIEVGTFHGVSVAYWAKHRPKVLFISIDPFVGEANISYWLKNSQPNNRLLVGTVRDLSHPSPLRFLQRAIWFVDGSHTKEDCLLDLETATDLNASQIWVHDYISTSLGGVKAAVDRFVRKGRFNIDRMVGTTVFLKKDE